MKLFVFLFCAVALFASTYAGKDYQWGVIGENDFRLAKDKVKHVFFVGVKVEEKYIFSQSDNLNAFTISAIRVIDQKNKNGASADLINGGPGSKGATILFTSERGHNIDDVVEIYARP